MLGNDSAQGSAPAPTLATRGARGISGCMLHDIDLVPLAADYTVAGQELAEASNLKSLEDDGSTRRVIMARMMTMRSTIVATGTISVFEALLQQSLGWVQPFPQLDAHLRAHGLDDLADRFLDYRDAINVLKHGAGRRHDRLLDRRERLDFSVRALEEPFHDEGDVSEVSTLVRADTAFVRNCGRLVGEVTDALRRTVPDPRL
jgi:hypothetical protein